MVGSIADSRMAISADDSKSDIWSGLDKRFTTELGRFFSETLRRIKSSSSFTSTGLISKIACPKSLKEKQDYENDLKRADVIDVNNYEKRTYHRPYVLTYTFGVPQSFIVSSAV